ncbi:MAG: ASCH domain-containing protein [Chloroflexi bacterium]|nr:ASCH domain-containing protein [Chloroflexota bacterium]
MNLKKVVRALSVRQPYAEQILRGTKKIEYRSIPTKIRERVYIYASKKRARFDAKAEREKFATGVLIGTVEIVDCRLRNGEYHWHLARPRRLAKLLKPRHQPQPVWFHPFD